MTILKSESQNATSLYVVKSIRENGKRTSKIVEKLGTVAELEKRLAGRDPYQWAREYAEELTRLEKEGLRQVMVKYSPVTLIAKDERRLFSGGYIFLQKIYRDLGLDRVSEAINAKYNISFDLDSVLSRLV